MTVTYSVTYRYIQRYTTVTCGVTYRYLGRYTTVTYRYMRRYRALHVTLQIALQNVTYEFRLKKANCHKKSSGVFTPELFA